jgi:aspartyl-tRNA(Asn)/glutamyl-tRNA(Gln) amidotransferase subunit A
MLSDEILFLPASELAKRIQSKALSPVELTKAYLDRSEKLGSKLNAYARLTPEIALAEADAAEKEIKRGHYRGRLHGIPYAAKDLLRKGLPTTGAQTLRKQVFDYDATVIEHLRRVGAILIGKAAMIELAGGMNYPSRQLRCRGRKKSLEHRPDLRIVFRFRRDRRGRTCGLRHRHGNLGLDCLSRGILRSERTPSHLRTR